MSPPPRSIAWVLLLASAAAVLLTGVAATAAIFAGLGARPVHVDAGFWIRLLGASLLTAASLGLRALRWIFLLRRSEVRIPIRDAYIGYLAGFSLLLAPFLLGEIVVRAYVHRVRCNVAPTRTVFLNIWERLYDVIALSAIATGAALVLTGARAPALWVVAAAAATLVPPRLTGARTSLVALATSVAAWLLPGVGLWLLANRTAPVMDLAAAQMAYARSSLAGGITLAPGGVLVTGSYLLAELKAAGLPEAEAVAAVVGIRLATVGVSTALGAIMLLVHLAGRFAGLKSRATYTPQGARAAYKPQSTRAMDDQQGARATDAPGGSHFDEIAGAYDVQIPAARRESLLATKTALMREQLGPAGAGSRGLDVGCGQGWYVRRMREMGFDVEGIDTSTAQIAIAARYLGTAAVIREGSVLDIPAANGSYDFVYTINVLHHLASVDDQRRAFAELARVLKPGGLLFVHEINTRNPIFRFYMGYVFPSLNCIDEGVERWLLPHRIDAYADLPVKAVRYFTFLPDFLPQPLVRLLSPIERWLERSRVAPYSAHYMAVLQKPA